MDRHLPDCPNILTSRLSLTTLAGVDWGAIAGAAGAVVGTVALVYAHTANQHSKRSNQFAAEANTIAAAARRLAQEANEMSRRSETRETERHDVRWQGEWHWGDGQGLYIITKLGDDEARHVEVTVAIDNEEGRPLAKSPLDELLASGERLIGFLFPQTAKALQFDSSLKSENRQRIKRGGPAELNPPLPEHTITEHVEWTTEEGNPRVHHEVKKVTIDTI